MMISVSVEADAPDNTPKQYADLRHWHFLSFETISRGQWLQLGIGIFIFVDKHNFLGEEKNPKRLNR